MVYLLKMVIFHDKNVASQQLLDQLPRSKQHRWRQSGPETPLLLGDWWWTSWNCSYGGKKNGMTWIDLDFFFWHGCCMLILKRLTRESCKQGAEQTPCTWQVALIKNPTTTIDIRVPPTAKVSIVNLATILGQVKHQQKTPQYEPGPETRSCFVWKYRIHTDIIWNKHKDA